MDIANKTCIITGASSGLGRGTAQLLRSKGAKVVNFDLKPPSGTDEDSGDLFAEVDVADETSVARGLDLAMDKFKAVHVCINCAGIAKGAPVLGDNGVFPFDLLRRTVAINLTGTFIVMALAAQRMSLNEPGADGERGVVVNTASIAGLDASSSAAYAASKGGVVSLTLTAARDLARYGIRVNAIAPGFMDTPMFEGLPTKWTDELIAKMVYPKRLGAAGEFAELVRHLIENRFMNASVIRLDGGARV
jgi:NAD(P)-dependent dehydrogenase (short-subunit alcohol dehydrogenase family)